MNIETLALKVLKTENQSVYLKVKERLDEYERASRMDYSLVPLICMEFCDIKGISIEDIRGKWLKNGFSDIRKELIAVILLFYMPQKVDGVDEKRISRGLRQQIAITLAANAKCVSFSIPSVLGYFNIYKTFRNNVLSIHDKIKTKIFAYN